VGSYRPLPEPPEVLRHAAKAMKELRFRTPTKLYIYDTLLKRPGQDLEDVAAELRQFVEKANPVVGEGDLARDRHLAAADQPDVRDGAWPPWSQLFCHYGEACDFLADKSLQATWGEHPPASEARDYSNLFLSTHRGTE
jgi:hypothetical protein